MFAETAFDDDDDDTHTTNLTAPCALSSDDFPLSNGRNSNSREVCCTVPLHRPGDEGFSCVAGSADDAAAWHDARSLSGDSWLSTDCHCVRCETLRVATKLSAHCAAPVVVVLLDLDNYGFNQFRAPLPRQGGGGGGVGVGTSGGFDVLRHLFVWAFFGSCFARHHGTFPDEESVSRADDGSEPKYQRPFQQQNTQNSQKQKQTEQQVQVQTQRQRQRQRRQSVWQRLVAQGRCHFTPCGGHRQAADSVMVRVAFAMTHVPVIIVSGDRGLLRVAAESRRRIGKKSRRDEESTEALSQLDIVDVHACGKRFLPVWEALEAKVRHIVCGHPKENERIRGREKVAEKLLQ